MSTLVAIPENKEIVFGDELRQKARREIRNKWKNDFMRHFKREERPVQRSRSRTAGAENESESFSLKTTSSIMDLHASMRLSSALDNIEMELDGTTASITVNENGDISVHFR
jgi:hypothetical protein